MPTLLDSLRQCSQVDCDTLDHKVAESLGPFVDCTSNQAIAYNVLTRVSDSQAGLMHLDLIKESIQDARGQLKTLQGDVTFEEFVVEILMVKLQLRFIPHLSGYVHVQTNPKLAYSELLQVENAESTFVMMNARPIQLLTEGQLTGIISIFNALSPDLVSSRVCIKIPATWEGLQACRKLEDRGVATLATTMFCMEQAALAADARCTYIAPYVNELKVHFEAGYVDEHKAFDFCREAQAYFLAKSSRTKVLAASLTSVDEVMRLAGIQHVTISPGLLQQLFERDASSWEAEVGTYFSQGPEGKSWETRDYESLVRDQSAWRLAFARSGFGTAEGKIIQAINYFSDFQDKMEQLVRQHA